MHDYICIISKMAGASRAGLQHAFCTALMIQMIDYLTNGT